MKMVQASVKGNEKEKAEKKKQEKKGGGKTEKGIGKCART